MNTAQIPQSDPEVFWLNFATFHVIPLQEGIFVNREPWINLASANQSSEYFNIKNPSANKRIPKREPDGFAGHEHLGAALRVIDRHPQNQGCGGRKYSP